MPKSAGEILGKLGADILPFGIGAGSYFAGNFLVTGTFLEAAEIGFLAGVGATMAMTGVIVVGAIAIPVGIALALGNNDFAATVSDAVHEVTPLLSPGAIALLPMSPFFTPNDPTLFARAFGPAFDLGTGALSERAIDKLGAEASAVAGFAGWKSDVINLGNYYSSGPSTGLGQNANEGRPSPVLSGEPAAGDNHTNSGALSSDFNAPGAGDSSSNSIDSTAPYFPELQTLRYDSYSLDSSEGDAPSVDGGPGNPADSNASGEGNETNGENSGTENGGSGQTDQGSGNDSSSGGDNGGSEGSGAGESSGGGNETGGADKPDHPDPERKE